MGRTAQHEGQGDIAPAAAASRRFSSYLRRIRKERRLSLRQVEKLSEGYPERVSNSYLAYCETGRLLPSLGKLITLSKVLGVPLQSFTDRLEIDREATPLPAAVRGASCEELRAMGVREAEAGRLSQAFTCFERALEKASDAMTRADLTMDLAIVLKRMSRHYAARDLLEEVLSIRSLDTGRTDRALILLAGVLREMGRLPIAAMVGREAMLRAAQASDPLREAHAASVLGNALFDMGCVTEAAPLYEKAVRVYRDAGDLVSLTTNLGNLGNCHVRLGRFAEGFRLLHEAEAIARREGFSRQVADLLGYLGAACALQGNVPRAEKLFFQSNQLARAGDYHDIVFANTWQLRELAVKRGRAAEAGGYLRTLRYLRGRIDSTCPEIRAFDSLVSPDAALDTRQRADA